MIVDYVAGVAGGVAVVVIGEFTTVEKNIFSYLISLINLFIASHDDKNWILDEWVEPTFSTFLISFMKT
jgi:hypothetical protein